MNDNDVILKGIVGSTAYGLATKDSDIDMLGIWVEPTENLLGLSTPKDTFSSNNPDVAIHEVGKFCRLAMKCNPTVLELLFLNDYEVKTDEGQKLIDIRQFFLDETHIRSAYIGYATSQISRLKKRGDFGSDLKKRYAKHARHTFRLLLQAEQLLSRSTMRVKVTESEREYLFSLGEMSIEELSTRFEKKVQEIDGIESRLETGGIPASWRSLVIEKALLDIRKAHY